MAPVTSSPASPLPSDAPTVVDSGPWTGGVPPAATAVVKRLEGFYPQPYDDNGAQPGGTWTIGYGSIVDADGRRVTPQTPAITEAQAEQLLRRDMGGAARDVQQRVQVPLRSCEAAALISWTYNLGADSLAKSTLLLRLNADRKAEVPAEMRRWIMHEGRPVLGLLRRRWAEAAIFLGMDPTQACVRAWREIDDLSDWPAF